MAAAKKRSPKAKAKAPKVAPKVVVAPPRPPAVASSKGPAKIADLKPHPRNYKVHPEEQLVHIGESLRQFGFFRDIVIARDNTILAGHGVVEAATKVGFLEVPTIRLDLAPTDARALKILALDNELGRFAETDDRALTELLKEVRDTDLLGLLGTGYDDQQLAALVMVTRPATELANFNAAAEWLGMPDYTEGENPIKLVVTFKTDADRKRFVDEQGMRIDKVVGTTPGVTSTWSTRWPWVEREDVAGIRFDPVTKKKTSTPPAARNAS